MLEEYYVHQNVEVIKSTLSNHVLLKEEEITKIENDDTKKIVDKYKSCEETEVECNITPERRELPTSTVFYIKSGCTKTVLNDRHSIASSMRVKVQVQTNN